MTDETKLKAKKELRAQALERRKAAFEHHGPDASRKIAAHGVDFLAANPGSIVSGFAAINDEINPGPLMTWLQAEGFRLALPVMQGPVVLEIAATSSGMSYPVDVSPACRAA